MTDPEMVGKSGDLDKGLKALADKQADCRLYQRYYDGDHDLVFATEKFFNTFGYLFRTLADNLCPVVVDAVADRLEVTGFTLEGHDAKKLLNRRKSFIDQQNEKALESYAQSLERTAIQTKAVEDSQVNTQVLGKPVLPIAPPQAPPPPKLMELPEEEHTMADDAWDIWNANRMDEAAGQVHQETLRHGTGYVIVWPSVEDPSKPVIYPQESSQVYVHRDSENRCKSLWAIKAWKDQESEQYFVTLYYPDRLEKYRTQGKCDWIPNSSSDLIKRTIEGESWPLPNPYGQVPVFQFNNNASVGKEGRSELISVKPIQDALNKALCDMLVAMEFQAMPQRWATGLEMDIDESTGKVRQPFKPGVDRIWAVANENTRFGQFEPGQLQQFLSVQDSFRLEVCRISGTPLTYMMLMSTPPSGESLKTLETRFVKKCKDRQTSYGNVWEDVMRFCLVVKFGTVEDDIQLVAKWANPAMVSELESVQLQVQKQLVGYSQERSLRELGLSESDIMENKAEKNSSLGENQAAMAESMRGFERGGGTIP